MNSFTAAARTLPTLLSALPPTPHPNPGGPVFLGDPRQSIPLAEPGLGEAGCCSRVPAQLRSWVAVPCRRLAARPGTLVAGSDPVPSVLPGWGRAGSSRAGDEVSTPVGLARGSATLFAWLRLLGGLVCDGARVG